MTFAEQNLDAFIDLLNKQPNLFSQETITNLEQLINNTSDNLDKLSTVIAGWYQKYPQIMDAQLALLSQYSSSVRGPGSRELNSNIPKYRRDKQSILNAIQQSSKSTKSDDNKQDKS